MIILGKLGPGPQPHITVVPPDPGVEADTNFNIVAGDEYCATFPGATAKPNDAKTFKVKNAPAPAACAISACSPGSPSGAFLDLDSGLF